MQIAKESAPKMYHVLTNGCDDWVEDESGAMRLFNHAKANAEACRLYSCVYNFGDDLWDDDECLQSFGEFPL